MLAVAPNVASASRDHAITAGERLLASKRIPMRDGTIAHRV
jgi:hypothetical protein